MSLSIAAGIDAGKFSLDLAIVGGRAVRSLRTANDPSGIAAIVSLLRRHAVGRVVLEAVGPYAAALVRTLADAGFEVGLVNPKRIKAFREAEGGRAKTDRLDARLIARFALLMNEPLRPIPSEEQRLIKALATRRRQIVEIIAMEKTRLKQAIDPLILDSHRRSIELLAVERKAIEAELDRRIEADPTLLSKRAQLISIPGIGKQIASVVLTEMPEIGTLNRRSAASLAGLAPHPNQSGAMPGRNAIGGGRPCLRAAFYMAALSAIRHDPHCKAEYQVMRAQGKPAKVAIIAIARKHLALANALIRHGKLYDPKASALD